MSAVQALPEWAASAINLAQPRLGSHVLRSSDDFFASHDRLLDPAEPVFKPGVYDENGKWMDGWESRRKRGEGHDHCTIALGHPGRIVGVELDTRHFTGNYVPAAALDACTMDDGSEPNEEDWTEILPPTSLSGDERQFFELGLAGATFTHLRLRAYPDGGIARLRVYGHISLDTKALQADSAIDLAALENGGRAVAASDAHFGELSNLIAPGRGKDMGDGWETRRRREPGFDWGIVKLAHAGEIERLEIDTAHFKGNFAFETIVYGGLVGDLPDLALPALAIYWPILLPATRLTADAVHEFVEELQDIGPVDHLRIDMVPDGGISRLRAWGTVSKGYG